LGIVTIFWYNLEYKYTTIEGKMKKKKRH